MCYAEGIDYPALNQVKQAPLTTKHILQARVASQHDFGGQRNALPPAASVCALPLLHLRSDKLLLQQQVMHSSLLHTASCSKSIR